MEKIGLIIPELLDPIDLELVSGAFEQAKTVGCDLVIYTGIFNSMEEYQQDYYTEGLENIYSLICKSDLDGIIFAAERFYNKRVMHNIFGYLSQTDIPCLTLGYKYKDYPYINAAQYDGAYDITKHLIEDHGCKRLFCIAGVPDHEPSIERLRGVLDAAEQLGCPIDKKNIIYGWYWIDIPKQIARDIAENRLEMPDAVVCLSDTMATAFVHELQQHGISAPGDIAVTGFDGSIYAVMNAPQITTSAGRERAFGEAAVCRLYEMITGEKCTSVGSQQYIRYGTSCGCAFGKRSVESGILHPLEHIVRTQLEKIYDKKTFLATDYIDSLSDAEDVDELMKKVDEVGHILRGWKWIDLCLCEDWQMSFDNPDIFRQHSYSDRMYLGLSKRHGINDDSGYYFDTSEIIPALGKPHEPTMIALTSLHCKGQIFGYCAVAYDSVEKIDIGEYHVRWCDAVASGLNLLQKRQYKTYVHQQIELLSTTDPVSGMLNKRGFLAELPDLLHSLRKRTLDYRLMLAAPVRVGSEGVFDIGALFAGFIKELDGIELCARLSDKCCAILISGTPDELQISEEIICSKLEKSIASCIWGTSSKPELVTESTEIPVKKPAELEQLVDSFTEVFDEKCSAAETSYESNKQLLYKLRREIMSQPEKDWNMTDISHDVGISRTHLNRLYRSVFEVSIKDDIINSRMLRAKQLLSHTELRIQEIAEKCGYQNENHFMRQFKERTGATASQYRKNPQ